MVVRDIDHVVGVYSAERCQTITDDGEKSDHDAVDDVNDVDLLAANIDPPDQEQHPGQTKDGNQKGVQCNQEAKC